MKRELWVIEFNVGDGVWHPNMSRCHNIQSHAIAACAACSKHHPNTEYRVVRYVPATGEQG